MPLLAPIPRHTGNTAGTQRHAHNQTPRQDQNLDFPTLAPHKKNKNIVYDYPYSFGYYQSTVMFGDTPVYF